MAIALSASPALDVLHCPACRTAYPDPISASSEPHQLCDCGYVRRKLQTYRGTTKRLSAPRPVGPTKRSSAPRPVGPTLHEFVPLPDPLLPADPFVRWLRAFVDRHESVVSAANRLRLDDRHVGRLLEHDQRRVHLSFVDSALVAAGDPESLFRLYPLDVEPRERSCAQCGEVVWTDESLICPWCESLTVGVA